MQIIAILSLVLLLVAVILLALVLRRSGSGGAGVEQAVREELRAAREDSDRAARSLREEVNATQHSATELAVKTITEMGKGQREALDAVTGEIRQLSALNEERLEKLRATVDQKLRELREGNESKLEEMRATVDEKLQKTLESRLGESFKQVSERLEAVQAGLGEMRNLATGVGDLKKVLSNVKTRGTLGEVQLGAILEEILTVGQYDTNVRTRPQSREMVEYAVKLPGPDDEPDRHVWLPIDSKFPQEDYQRLVDAQEEGDVDAIKSITASLVRSVKNCAKDISEKYVCPPDTTDFAIMFLPTEGLYAEVLRQPGLLDELMRANRVVVAGPTTLAAILSSLRMGFRTLAIEKRSSEVWQVLAAVKTEFGNFETVLAKLEKQLGTAQKTVSETGVRTRAIERRLREVEELPEAESGSLLGLETGLGEAVIIDEEEGVEREGEDER
ncbi:MAG: DNA recombination protein RmuC [Candidatus Eisenbacteria bacterium]|nr:DNA recombination protein RmuC [Candidatus Eisenbacteria bacterium]